MTRLMLKLTVAALAVTAIQDAASAQTAPPNFGNYQALTENYRIGAQVFNPALGVTIERSFQQQTITDITDFLDPFELAFELGNLYSDQSRVSQVFDLRGAPVLAGYALNSPALTVVFVDPTTGATVTDNSGAACSFTYNGATRDASFATFDADTDGSGTPEADLLARCLSRSLARFSPVDPLAGNPFSLLGSMAKAALDLSEGGSLVEQDGGANSAGDPWIIGAAYSGGSADRFNLDRIDARVAKGWRVFEGNRARLKLDIPFSYTTVQGAAAYSGQIGLGLEMPLKDNVWSIEPRISYGIAFSGDQGTAGHIVQGTVTSRVAINGLGRGRFVIGNMIGYSTTLNTPGDTNLNPEFNKFLFRNGLAYDLPLKLRLGNRGTSVRGSYTFTNFTGERLFNNNFHEITLSFGLRGREDSPKALRDVFRINFSTVQAKGFSAGTVGVGFKF
jgi:hypothetical protein